MRGLVAAGEKVGSAGLGRRGSEKQKPSIGTYAGENAAAQGEGEGHEGWASWPQTFQV